MNLDLSIHRMAFRETESLSVAQSLVGRKRADLEMRELREKVLQDQDATSSSLDTALRRMEDASEAARQAAEQREARAEDRRQRVDKTA